jgi:hypothetical protein
MKFNFKSLHQSNVVFVFDQVGFISPENSKFAGIYEGEAGTGARFVDDPVIQSKFLSVPKKQLTVSLEGLRLRIDDESKLNPDSSTLVEESVKIYSKLFDTAKLSAYGFNFDFFYRFPELIPSEYLFKTFVSEDVLKKSKLSDLGIQFVLDKDGGRAKEVYFIKITSPLELAVHYNYHAMAKELPKKERLQELFEKAYEAADELVNNLKF